MSTLHGFDKMNLSLLAGGGLRLVDLEAGHGVKMRVSEPGLPDETLFVAMRDQLLEKVNGRKVDFS